MTDIRFSDGMRLRGTQDVEGGALRVTAYAARTGVQDYRAHELGLMGDDIVRVYRPEEAVFDRASIEGYGGAPVTLGHPDELVTADNWREHARGEVGQDIVRDGEHVRVSFTVRDAAAVAAIKDGTRQISMGYLTPVEMRAGTAPDGTTYDAVQTGPIQINHLAIVPKARGGDTLRIGDGADPRAATPAPRRDDPAPTPRKDALMTTQTVVLGDEAVTVPAAEAPTIIKHRDAQAKALADKDAEIAAKDEEIGKLKAEAKEAKDALPDAATLDAMATERAEVLADAKALAPKVETAGKSLADIRRAVVADAWGEEAAKPMSDAEIKGAFGALSRSTTKTDAGQRLADGAPKRVDDGGDPWAFMDEETKQ